VSEVTRALLKKLLISSYAHLARRLERVAGSPGEATDALHETWLNLETAAMPGSIANPDAYLLTMATNAVTDQFRREKRHLHEEEIDEYFHVADECADTERIVSARQQIDRLKAVLLHMPERRRAILVAARIDGRLNREIAEQFGISLRLVERELALGMQQVIERFGDGSAAGKGASKGPRKY
jgi:RNA polymerase sigma-70 factor (ECF subfamily)